jgi:hypothetical protein
LTRAGATLGVAALIVAAACVAPAGADRDLVVGVSDDSFLWNPVQSAAVARDLGATAFRISLRWDGASRSLSAEDASMLDRVASASKGLRMIVAIYGDHADSAPQTDPQRDAFCTYAADVLQHYASVHDVVVWNEANLSYFWRPQFGPDGSSSAPAAYEALLARCWDVLHSVRSDANVIADISSRGNDNPGAASNISHSPGTFIAGLGQAYRASGRTRPIFDTFGHHPYSQSSEPPAQEHPRSTQISEGDLDRLLNALEVAFGGTGQPVPGLCSGSGCPTIWYLEAGYQTVPAPDKASLYTNFETEPAVIPDGDGSSVVRDQGSQLRAGLGLAYCQQAVGGFFNFLLADEPDLAGWQSGVLWADWSRKASYAVFQQTIGSVAAGRIDCARAAASPTLPGGLVGAGPVRSSGTPPAGSTAQPRGRPRSAASVPPRAAERTPAGVLRLARRYASIRLHLREITALESYRSRWNAHWVLVDGFYGPQRRGLFALWMRRAGRGWEILRAARDHAATLSQRNVPCDLSRAFSRPSCT